MVSDRRRPVEALIVAVPETAGSTLYGMVDVFSAAGSVWQELVGTEKPRQLIRPRIVSTSTKPFRCANGIPMAPDLSIASDPKADIVILPELWLAHDEDMKGRYPKLMDWIRRRYECGSTIYSACSGSLMLAETGLLTGKTATSHWGYEQVFRHSYPAVDFRAESTLRFADASGRIVTAGGGIMCWQNLVIHIISRHCSPGEALRVAKLYLMKWNGEGQLPYASLVRAAPHADSIVRACSNWLDQHYREANAVTGVEKFSGLPRRSLKRRFKAITGSTLIERVQNLRVEEAKRLLETAPISVDEVSAAVGYEDSAFFRRLFRRLTGLTPTAYRRMFRPIAAGQGTAGSIPEI